MKKCAIRFTGLILVLLLACCGQQRQQAQQKIVYKGVTTEASYAYHLAGGENWLHGFAIKVDNAKTLSNPGLVFLGKCQASKNTCDCCESKLRCVFGISECAGSKYKGFYNKRDAVAVRTLGGSLRLGVPTQKSIFHLALRKCNMALITL